MVPDHDDGGDPIELRLNELYAALEATSELPIDREANRWLGEAEAVARDAAMNELETTVARERVGEVDRLLSEVGEVDSERARERVAEAKRLCGEILDS
ncbi:hypothetical protein [Saliphagus sp. LR7]|uniref:hypothetical protein n=1 Tax=Saliphagus sp. LR7 TaxID=2282654 RepID=UPI000DF77E01|nr:hypothetical protein [Saliphagus sp. LR7]